MKFDLKKIAENFPNLGRDLGIQVHEIYRSSFYLNTKDLLRNSIMKLSKIKYKDKILKAVREKNIVTHKETPFKLLAVFLAETL